MRLFAFARTHKLGLALAALLLVWSAVGFLPLFGGPGYEAALALGLLLPLPLALITALRARSDTRIPLGAWSDGMWLALGLVLACLAINLLHGVRVGFCDPLEGLVLLLLGPASGALMAATWGSLSGLVARRLGLGPGLALGLAALGPAGGVLLSFARFLGSPMIFAFDPFAGFFAGTLYDTVIDAIPRLLTYRLGSLGTLVAVGFGLYLLEPGERAWRAHLGEHRPSALLCVLGALASFTVYWQGPALGHYQTSSSIRDTLGHRLESARCEIVYASGVSRERAELLGKECDAHVGELERYFGTQVPERITVLLFRSDEQKGALMGASRTYIAKPWRNEIYIQDANYPHPVIRHELAHVVAGTFAKGPFKVAGPLGGWIPDPGRVEGFAVAAAPREDTDQSLLEWSAALAKLELLPSLRTIFRLTFLGEYSTKAYTIAGAFVSWFREQYGAEATRRWYAGESVESVTNGKSLAELDREFRELLASVSVPDRQLELARARFDQPALFARSCPHVVDRLLLSARGSLGDLDLDRAEEQFRELLALDPESLAAKDGLVTCALRRGDAPKATAQLEALAARPELTAVERAGVWQQLGDRALSAGALERAREYYDDALEFALSEQEARTLDVKRFATLGPGRQVLVDLLIGDDKYGQDIMEASAGLGAWSARDASLGIADYLLGRNLYERARWERAAFHLDRALARELPLERVKKEALRLRTLLACAQGELDLARAMYTQYLASPDLSEARKEGMRRVATRCGIAGSPG
jgi:tetratricopeptide (TPR) repeat protein